MVAMNVFTSMLAARLGDERLAVQAQDAAAASLPASIPSNWPQSASCAALSMAFAPPQPRRGARGLPCAL
jgi:hypothetical protein